MDGGWFLSPVCGGSWQIPSQGDPNGHAIWTTQCIAERESPGVVKITQDQPISDGNITCLITVRGFPVRADYAVEQVSDTVRRVRFTSGELPMDVSFDWAFFRSTQIT